jgi:hypothetical protein
MKQARVMRNPVTVQYCLLLNITADFCTVLLAKYSKRCYQVGLLDLICFMCRPFHMFSSIYLVRFRSPTNYWDNLRFSYFHFKGSSSNPVFTFRDSRFLVVQHQNTSELHCFYEIQACIIRAIIALMMGAPLKRRSTSTRLHGATSQKSVIFILVALRIWNLAWNCDVLGFHRYIQKHKYENSINFWLPIDVFRLLGRSLIRWETFVNRCFFLEVFRIWRRCSPHLL